MTHQRSLPPPIFDKSSGKTFVAIPAPNFVLPRTDNASGAKSSPSFVYVQASPSDVTKTKLIGRQANEKTCRSVGAWMRNSITAEPPPGHVPWKGISADADSPEKSSKAVARSTNTTPVPSRSSASTLEIPLCDKRTLVHETLPSADSQRWFDGLSAPHIQETLKMMKLDSTTEVLKNINGLMPVGNARKKNRRQTLCVTDIASGRREASIFKRRTTDQYRGPTTVKHKRDKALSTLGDIDDSVSLAIGRIDNAMAQLQKEKDKLDREMEPPALVVSTSHTTSCISGDDVVKAVPPESAIAKRRGKDSPGVLHLPSNSTGKSDEYPDLPTPFQCATTPNTSTFTEAIAPIYPELILDNKMSAEDMINSLRHQVENFIPHSPLGTNVDDAEGWLKDELGANQVDSGQDLIAAFPPIPNSRPQTQDCTEEKVCERSLLPYANSQNLETDDLPSPEAESPPSSPPLGELLSAELAIDQSTPRAARKFHSMPSRTGIKPQRSILVLHDGSSQSPTVRKRVRFSSVEAQSIDLPLLSIFEPPSIPLPEVPTVPRDAMASPPRRKFPPNKGPIDSSLYTPKPVSLIAGPKRLTANTKPLKSSPLNPQRTMPSKALPAAPTPKSAKVKETPIKQRRFSTISGRPSDLKMKEPILTTPIVNSKKFSIVQPTSLPRGPLIFTTNSGTREGSDKLRRSLDVKSTTKVDAQRRQSQAVGGKENQAQRLLSLTGLSITRKRSFTSPETTDKRFSRTAGNGRISVLGADAAGKDTDALDGRKPARRSMPFQSMLNRLRG